MSMVMSTTDSGRTTKPADMGRINITTEPSTRESGLMIINTGRELKLGLTAADTKDTMQKAKRMERVNILGKMEAIL